MEAQGLWPTVERRHEADRRSQSGGADLHERIDRKLKAAEFERRGVTRRQSGAPRVEARLSLKKLAELARQIASELDPSLEVFGVTGGKGGTGYVEVLLRFNDCDVEPCRITMGADRTLSRQALEKTLRESMRGHLQEHRQRRAG